MTIEAKVIEDSIAENGRRLTTLQLCYPRFIHAEFMTHRVFSRNASSSRAIPAAKLIQQVRNEPAMPIHWGKNQSGMQAREEHDAWVGIRTEIYEPSRVGELDTVIVKTDAMSVQDAWRVAANKAADVAEAMSEAGYHKQVVNRLLEPFLHISVIMTATEFDNFFELRDHPDAQPEIHELAIQMKQAMNASTPVLRPREKQIAAGWHLPYVTFDERAQHFDQPVYLAKLSAARCARVSYLTHDGRAPNSEEDLTLYNRLVGSRPLHASPIEHQAYPLPLANQRSKNFVGWRQHREIVEISPN